MTSKKSSKKKTSTSASSKPVYDWKKTARKAIVMAAIGAIGSIVSYASTNPVPPSYAVYMTLAVSVLVALRDYLRHSVSIMVP